MNKIEEEVKKEKEKENEDEKEKNPSKKIIKQKNIEELLSYKDKDIKNFNAEEFCIRKYNKNNVESGKIFFKYRYIKNKLEEISKTIPRKSVFNIKDLENLKLINKKEKRLSYSLNLNLIKNEENYNDKNDFRIFNSTFLTIVEKSIIHFNMKKYKESYKVLFQEKIINSENEFGEFLLVVNGYDKNILGTFLSKKKPPNENKEVINGFINSIDLKYIKLNINNNNNYFLECLRFLLSRLNLPQDANLILEIMDTFSTFLFNNNKDNEEFILKYSSINDIYLLISTLLALNTMFTRKDIKNMNIIKKEQFLEMNKKIEKNEGIDIYDKLEKEPISMSYNYKDIIYQKMAVLVKEKDINISLQKSVSSLITKTQIKNIEKKDDKIILEEENSINENENSINENENEDSNENNSINENLIKEENSLENEDEIGNLNVNEIIDKRPNKIKKTNTSININGELSKHKIFEKINLNEKINKDDEENIRQISFSYLENLYNFSEKDKSILTKPTKFIKLINKNSFHKRIFVVDEKLEKLIWAKEIDIDQSKNIKIKGNLHTLLINEIENVHNGIEKSQLISEYIKNYPNEVKEANHFISIITSNKSFCIKAEIQEIALSWFKALKSLVIKNKNKNKNNDNDKNKINIIKFQVKNIWYTLILPKWNIYGNYLNYKIQNKINYLKEKQIIKRDNNINIFSKNIVLLEEKTTFSIDDRNKFIIEAKNKIINNNYLEYDEFIYFYNFGLPSKLRGKIWSLLIGNPLGITQKLYNIYKKQISSIDFEKVINEFEKNKNLEQTLSEINENIYNDKLLINQIILDILSIKDKYLIKYTISPFIILSEVYTIIRVFFLMRPDITYNKSLISFSFIFILVCKDEFISFCNIFNLINTTNTLQFYLKNEDYIDSRVKYFDDLLKNKIPKISLHFKNLDISSELFLVSWFENIFSFTFDYHILRRIFDLYLLHGEYILFQVGLTIIKIQEDELLNFTISEIFKVLGKLPNEYKEDYFMEKLYLMNIHKDFEIWKINNDIKKQKDKFFDIINNKK